MRVRLQIWQINQSNDKSNYNRKCRKLKGLNKKIKSDSSQDYMEKLTLGIESMGKHKENKGDEIPKIFPIKKDNIYG